VSGPLLPVAVVAGIGLALSACTPVWEGGGRRLQHASAERSAVRQAQAVVDAADAEPQAEPVAAALEDLDDLVRWGIDRHPAVHAQLATIAGHHARSGHVGSLDEPQVMVRPFGDQAQTAAGEVTLMATIRQGIPAPGTLTARVEAADAETRAAIAELDGLRVDLAREIRAAWWREREAAAAQRVLEEQAAVLEALRALALARVETGGARQADVVAIDLDRGELRTRQRRWVEARDAARAALRAALALDADRPPPEVAAPPLVLPDAYDLAWFHATAAAAHPDYAANDAALARAGAARSAARARRRPDFAFAAGYAMVDDAGLSPVANGDDQWWVGVGVSLPLWWGAYRSAEAEAVAMQRAAGLERRALADRLQRVVHTAWLAYQSVRDQRALFSAELLPLAAHGIELERAGFAAGNAEAADVLRALRRALALELQDRALLRRQGEAWAELIASAGLIVLPEVSDE